MINDVLRKWDPSFKEFNLNCGEVKKSAVKSLAVLMLSLMVI